MIDKNNIFIKKCTGFEQEKQIENVNIITSKEDKRLKEEKMVEEEDLSLKTLVELKQIAKARKIKGYSSMKKEELLTVLK